MSAGPKSPGTRKASHTSASAVLGKNITRTRAFTKIFFAGNLKPKAGDKRKAGQPSTEERELLRAAVTFSIGALDAYLSEVAAEVLVAQLEAADSTLGQSARGLLRRIAKEMDTLTLELALTIDPARRRAVARQAILEHLTSQVSNHGSKSVAATLSRMGDASVSVIWTALNARASDWPILATSGRSSAEILDHWTANRHKIIHEGTAVPVSGEQAKQLIDFIEALAKELDVLAVAALP